MKTDRRTGNQRGMDKLKPRPDAVGNGKMFCVVIGCDLQRQNLKKSPKLYSTRLALLFGHWNILAQDFSFSIAI